MKISERYITLAVLVVFLILSGCGGKTYSSEAMGLSFMMEKGSSVTETDGSLIYDMNRDIRIVILSWDASDMIGEDYASSNPVDDLSLLSGAFDTNYNNPVYDRELFGYILSGSPNTYTPVSIGYTSFSDMTFVTGDFTSDTAKACGSLYLTIEHNTCYMICIYINDSYENMSMHDRDISAFKRSFTIEQRR